MSADTTQIETTNHEKGVEFFPDRINPVLVKDLRMILNGRMMISTFMLILFVAWAVFLFLVTTNYDATIWGQSGSFLFTGFFMVLMVPLCIIVPLVLYESMREELHSNTFEVLAISPISARRIALGKLQSAILHMSLYFSAIIPFVCVCYLIGGVGIVAMLYVCIMAILFSIGMALWSLMWGALAQNKFASILGTLAVFFGGFITYAVAWGTISSILMMDPGIEAIMQLGVSLFCFGFFALFFVLITWEIAVSRLDPIDRAQMPYDVVEYEDGTVQFVLPSLDEDDYYSNRNRAEREKMRRDQLSKKQEDFPEKNDSTGDLPQWSQWDDTRLGNRDHQDD